jgi:hypothetical protein
MKNPFHRLKKWNGHYFEHSNLNAVGVILHMGHGGKECPSYDINSQKAEEHIQLFQMHLCPASYSKPSTGFTFDVLDDYHLESMECKTACSNYYNKLRHCTNDAFPETVPVST